MGEYFCPECDMNFDSEGDLQAHKADVHGGEEMEEFGGEAGPGEEEEEF